MLRPTFSRVTFCLIGLSFFIPVVVPAQQPPPSVMLDINVDPQGQIGAIVRAVEPGPNVSPKGFFQKELSIPWAQALLEKKHPSRPVMEPLFDRSDVPNGLMRTKIVFPSVCIPVGRPITPGFTGYVIPNRLASTLTPQSFLDTMLADYVIEINGVKFMDDDLYSARNVTISPPLSGILFGLPPNITLQFWGLNVTQKITKPGKYLISNYIRIPQTILLPEFSAIIPDLSQLSAGEFVVEQTINVQPSCSTIVGPPGDDWKTVGEPTVDDQPAPESPTHHECQRRFWMAGGGLRQP